MARSLAVLIVEDSESDAKLVIRLLQKAGYKVAYDQVDTSKGMRSALKKQAWDIVISDYSLPQFDGMAALNLLKETGLDIPFIVVSGTMGEETAVAMMKAGAHDYLTKGALARLVPAIERELEQAVVRRERRQAQDGLQASEKRFRALIENNADAITLLDANGKAVYDSPAASGMLGYGPDAWIGQDVFKLLHPDDLHKNQQMFQDLLKKPGARADTIFRVRHKSGSWLWIEAVATNLLEESGVNAVVLNYRDVSERKRAEEALRESESVFRGFLEQSEDAIMLTDEQGVVIQWSKGAEKLTGYSRAESIGLPLWDVQFRSAPKEFMSSEHYGFMKASLETILHTGRGPSLDHLLEAVLQRPDGTRVSSQTLAFSISTDKGYLLGSILRDITERKQAEVALRESEEKWRSLFTILPVGVSILDSQRTISELNPALEKILGISQQSSQDGAYKQRKYLRSDGTLMPANEFPSMRAVEEQRIIDHTEMGVVKEDGVTVWTDVSAAPLPFSDASCVIVTSDITDRKQAEEALRISEERFRTLYENNTLGLYRTTPDGQILLANPALIRMLGFASFDELRARNLDQAGYEPSYPRSQFLELIESQGQVQGLESVWDRQDGSFIFVRESARAIRDSAGKTLYYDGTVEDITQRKQAEDRLKVSEERFSSAFEYAAIGMALVSTDGLWLRVNRALCDLLGYSEEELLKMTFQDITHPDDLDADLAYVRQLLAGEIQSYKMEKRYFHRSGKTVWVLLNVSVVRGVHGEPLYFISQIDNITERKQAEEQLSEERNLLRTLIDNIPDRIDAMDTKGRKTLSNLADWQAAGGKTMEDVVGKTDFDVYPQELAEEYWALDKATLESGKPIVNYEERALDAEGNEVSVLSTKVPLRDAQGNVMGLVGVGRDISERKQAEEALRASEVRYKGLFEDSPIALWEEDFSAVKARLDALQKEGVNDIENYFALNPEAVAECATLVKVVEVNKAAIRMYGAKQKEEIISGLKGILGINAGNGFHNELVNIANGKTRFGWEVVNRTLDGRLINIDLGWSVAPGYENSLSKVIISMIDITERKYAEEALRASEDRYKGLFEDSPIALWEEDFSTLKGRLDAMRAEGITDFQDYFSVHPEAITECVNLIKVIDVNKATISLFGAGQKEEVIINMAEIFSGMPMHILQDELVNIANGNTRFSWEGANKTLDGRLIDIELTWSVAPGFEDTLSRVILSMNDVTQRKQAEAALAKSEMEYRDLFENMPIGLYRTSADGRILDANEAMVKMFGYKDREALLAENVIELYVDPVSDLMFKNEIEKNGVVSNFVAEFRRPDGTTFWTEDHIRIIRDVEGKPLSYEGSLIDISERRRVEAERQALAEILQGAAVIGSLQGFLEVIQRSLNKVLSAENFFVVFRDPNSGLFEEVFSVDKYDQPMPPSSLEKSITSYVFRTGEPLLLTEAKFDELVARGELELVGKRMASWLGAPLKTSAGTIGVIAVQDYEDPDRYSERDRAFLASVSGQVALAIERKQAEEALQKSERVLREAESLGHTSSWEQDLVTGKIFNTGGNLHLFFGDDQSKGGPFEDYAQSVHPDDREFVLQQHAQLLEGGPGDIEYRVVWPDGSIHVIFGRASVVRDKSGKPIRVYGTNVDITERKQAERLISRSKEDLALINSLNESVNRGDDIHKIAEKFVTELDRLIPSCRGVTLYLLDANGNHLEMPAMTLSPSLVDTIEKLIGRPIPKINIPIRKDGYFRKVLEDREGRIISDPDTIQKWISEFTETTFLPSLARTGIRMIIPQILALLKINSVMTVPLTATGRTIGLVDVSSEGILNEEDMKRVQGISGQVTEVILHWQAQMKIRSQLQHLAALREIDQVVISSFDLHNSLNEIIKHVKKELDVDAADILLLNSTNLFLEYNAGVGFRSRGAEKASVRLGQNIAGRVALERQLVQVLDLKNEGSGSQMQAQLAGEEFVSYFGLPLIAKGNLKGVLEVFHRSRLEPDMEWFDLLNTLGGQAALAVDNASLFENLQRSNIDLSLAYDATIEGWSHAMDLRDKETEGHTLRVTEMTIELAGLFGIKDEEMVGVRRGALLHDIGKMGVPDGILLKPDKLTDEEWVLMRKHPRFAFEMLSPIRYLQSAIDIPYCHHEKWDGTGYPRGLKGEQIPLPARIFAIADVWDAVTSDRPYRKAWSKEKAIEYLKSEAGKHFDPQVVKICLEAGVFDR